MTKQKPIPKMMSRGDALLIVYKGVILALEAGLDNGLYTPEEIKKEAAPLLEEVKEAGGSETNELMIRLRALASHGMKKSQLM